MGFQVKRLGAISFRGSSSRTAWRAHPPTRQRLRYCFQAVEFTSFSPSDMRDSGFSHWETPVSSEKPTSASRADGSDFFRAKSSRICGFGKRDGNKQGALPGVSQSANQPVDRSPCFLRSTYGSLPMPRSPNGPSSAYLDGAAAWQRVPMKTGTKPNNQQSTVCFLLMA